MDNLISVQELVYSYQNKEHQRSQRALDGINLTFKSGDFVCILGANGSGKSTLAKHLNALLLPNQGKVIVNGLDTLEPDNLWRIRSQVGMVFQNPDNQIVAAVVEEDVAFGLENLGIPSPDIRTRVDWALELVGMSDFQDRGPHLLSGGQKQRLCIAGVMAMQPAYMVLDEPTAMLDPQGRSEVLQTVHQLNEHQGLTVVLITHNMEEALLADRVIVMSAGKVVMDGSPRHIFSQPQLVREYGLEVPVVVEVAEVLRQQGLNIPDQVMTLDEMVAAICK